MKKGGLGPYRANLVAEATREAASRANVDATRWELVPRPPKADSLPCGIHVAPVAQHSPGEPPVAHAWLSPQSHSLRVNSVCALAGNIVYAACQWGMLVVLAKLGSPEMVGHFALAVAVTAPIIMLSMLQLRAVLATDAKSEYQFGHYLALRIATSVMAILLIAGVTFWSGYRPEVAHLVLAVGLFKAVEGYSDAYHGLMQKCERMDRVALAKVMKGISLLVTLTAVVVVTKSLLWGVTAMTIVSMLLLISYERVKAVCLLGAEHRNLSRPLWEWHRLAQLAWFALPLGVVMMLISLDINIPKYWIERELGERELGYFAAIAYLQVVSALVVGALGQTATPRLAQYYATGRYGEYLRLLAWMACIGILLGIGGITVAWGFGRELLTFLYRADYAQYSTEFVWLMAASGLAFVASVLGYGMTAARLFGVQVPLFAGLAALTALLCAWAVPQWGVLGVAYALVLVAIAKILGASAVVWWALRNASKTGSNELLRRCESSEGIVAGADGALSTALE